MILKIDLMYCSTCEQLLKLIQSIRKVVICLKPTMAFIGAGRVGTSLAILFKQAGYPVIGIASRTEISAQKAASLADIPVITPETACNNADILFITTPDREISAVVDQLSSRKCFKPGQIVVHTSGAHSAELLLPARKFGSLLLSFHPLQSFPHPSVALVNLRGSIFTLEGDEAGINIAVQMARDLNGEPVVIKKEQKVLYHAGACAASNYVVSVLHLALSLLHAAGFSHETARQALLPLMRGTLTNLEKTAPAQALTGPIARGDASTLCTHLSSLAEHCPDLLNIYRQLALYTIEVAHENNTLDAEQLDALRKLCSQDNPSK